MIAGQERFYCNVTRSCSFLMVTGAIDRLPIGPQSRRSLFGSTFLPRSLYLFSQSPQNGLRLIVDLLMIVQASSSSSVTLTILGGAMGSFSSSALCFFALSSSSSFSLLWTLSMRSLTSLFWVSIVFCCIPRIVVLFTWLSLGRCGDDVTAAALPQSLILVARSSSSSSVKVVSFSRSQFPEIVSERVISYPH